MSRLGSCAWFVFPLVLLAGCGKVAQSKCPDLASGLSVDDRPENMKGLHPEFFGDGKVRCSGKRLADQGFGGTLDGYAEIEYLGKIQTEVASFSIYYYDRNENHGSHAVVMFQDGCDYFGSYVVDSKPIKVSGQNIIFDAPEKIGNVIHFSGISPPARVVIDGSIATFTR